MKYLEYLYNFMCTSRTNYLVVLVVLFTIVDLIILGSAFTISAYLIGLVFILLYGYFIGWKFLKGKKI